MPKKNADRRPEKSIALGCIEVKRAMADAAAVAEGTFTATASVFNEPHGTSAWWMGTDWSDIMDPGAFDVTLAEHKKRGSRPSMLFNHNMDQPVGAWLSIEPDKKGLQVEGLLAIKTQLGADTYELMKVGAIPGASIGFVPIEYELDEKKKTRTILAVDLYEISPVSIPADPGALITDVKKFDPTNIREIEAALRDAGFSATEAKRLLAGGFKALAQRDAEDDAGLKAAFDALKKQIKGE